MPVVKFLESSLEPEETQGYVTKCETFAAIPYVKGQFIILHQGKQIRTCKNLTTAKNFISQELRKLK